eukprot:4318555-Prorocentrum_lima.AAC.1
MEELKAAPLHLHGTIYLAGTCYLCENSLTIRGTLREIALILAFMANTLTHASAVSLMEI